MKVLRTPDERFDGLPDFPYKPNYLMVPDGEGGRLRIHYLDEGPKDATRLFKAAVTFSRKTGAKNLPGRLRTS